jgi:hypothetical protein
MTEEEKTYLLKLTTYSENTLKIVDYSMQRIDLLIISVSGAGIYICLQILQFIHEKALKVNTLSLKFTGCLFVASIIVNFIGQWCSYKANNYQYEITESKIYDIENKVDRSNNRSALVCYSSIYNKINNISNIISTSSMLVGLVLIIVFICSIF